MSVDRGWALLYEDLGIDLDNVLGRARLPADLFVRENAKLTVSEYFSLWTASEAEAGDPAISLRVVEAITAEAFHPMVFAALCSPDLTVAMQRIATYKRLVVPMTVTVDTRGGDLVVSKRWDGNGESLVPASLAATELALLVKIARIGLRERIVPVSVMTHLPMEPEEAYTSYLGVAPVQGATRQVTFHADDARRPFLTARSDLWKTFEPDLQRRITGREATAPLAEHVRSALLESLPSGEASITGTARRLGFSSRTLQRLLKSKGTSFEEVLRTTREQLARHYLTNTQLAYAEISFLLGFQEPNSFFRAFRQWTGETPESARLAAYH